MMKTLTVIAFAAVAFAAPAFADDMMKCDDASMTKLNAMVMAMDASKKDQMAMAMKEVDMAKASMKDGKMDDCSMHMDNAMKQTK
jgi:hypothetical protein